MVQDEKLTYKMEKYWWWNEKQSDDVIFTMFLRADNKVWHIKKNYYSLLSLLAESSGLWNTIFIFLSTVTIFINRVSYMNSVLGKLFLAKALDKDKLNEIKRNQT